MNQNKSKVTLTELVATKIIFAILGLVYYWMWARRSWHNYYETIQYFVAVFTFIFLVGQSYRIRKFKAEAVDEFARQNLLHTDSICYKIGITAFVVIAFIGIFFDFTNIIMGYTLMVTILMLTIIRTFLFIFIDKKGIQ